MIPVAKYKFSDYSIYLSLLGAVLISCLFTWSDPASVNFFGGDARYYYYYLQSTFIDPSQVTYDWLSDPTPLTHHPAGLSVLLFPFFIAALLAAQLFHFPLTGLSLPFQLSVSVAAITYCFIGLVYLKKLFRLNRISDAVTALIIPLVFFGTTLLHYTLTESGMSHAYSFCLITVFMYHSQAFVIGRQNKHLLYAAMVFALILLVRVNNGLILFSVFFWFTGRGQSIAFFKDLLRNRYFYLGALLLLLILSIQPLAWLAKEKVLFSNRYAPYGFYWSKPALWEMLFGFNAGLFIYAPLCFLFLLGLPVTYKKDRVLFYGLLCFLLFIFYFFSAYSAYTYYDGLGLRVLVDYYALFALLGAKLFSRLEGRRLAYVSASAIAVILLAVNLVYCYQGSHDILARSGMNYNKWKYVFLKTGDAYRSCLGGSNDLVPFAKTHPAPSLASAAKLNAPFDYDKKDFGLSVSFDSLGFSSNRICLKIGVDRKEQFANSSRDALVCAMLATHSGEQKGYTQFRLNETPSDACCADRSYHYVANLEGRFRSDDRLSVYLWNLKQQPFVVNTFSVEVYNYNYQTN